MKAAVLVQSTNKSTYHAVLNQLIELNTGINDINWIFIDTTKDRGVTPSDKKINEHHIDLKNVIDLKKVLNEAKVIDVSGLSKENLIRVFSAIAGTSGVKLYTLSKDLETGKTKYIDLTEDADVARFLSKISNHKKISTILSSISLIVLASLIVLWLLNFDSSSPFITWLGIFLGILGIALTFIK